MTRTRTGEYKGLAASQRDRHQSRNGADPRAIPKKAGAGNGNWGTLGCEYEDSMGSSATSPPENKITVTDAATFSQLQNHGNKSLSNVEQNSSHLNGDASSSSSSSV